MSLRTIPTFTGKEETEMKLKGLILVMWVCCCCYYSEEELRLCYICGTKFKKYSDSPKKNVNILFEAFFHPYYLSKSE